MARPAKPWFWVQRNCWCVNVQGRRYILAHGQSSKAAALEAFHVLMASLGRAEVTAPERITFTELAEAFLESVAVKVERGERASVTYEGYVHYLSHAAARLGAWRVADLKPYHVANWLDAPGLDWGSTTRANAVTALKAMTRWGRKQGRIRVDPFADLEKPAREKRQAVLTDEQIRRVLEVTQGTPFADLVLGLWESGCRPHELTTLTADRVDCERGVWLVVNKTRRKTGHEFRPVFLTTILVDLSRRLVEQHPVGLIFRNTRGRAWTRNAQACQWRRLRKLLDYGPEATSYAIRHRYGIEGLRRGLDSSELAALMGHTNASMVDQVYGHWERQEERLRAAARRVRSGGESSHGGSSGAAEPGEDRPTAPEPADPSGNSNTPPAPPR